MNKKAAQKAVAYLCDSHTVNIYRYKTIEANGNTGVTLPIAEILSGKNARAFLVSGFLMKAFKNNILKK